MDSYYPSLVAGSIAFGLAGLMQRLPQSCSVSRCYKVLEPLAFLYIILLFVHFCSDMNCLWIAALLFVCSSSVFWYQSASQPIAILRSILLSIGLCVLNERLASIYPFMNWHGISTVYFMAGVWFVIGRAFTVTVGECYAVLFMVFVLNTVRASVNSDFHSLVNFYGTEQVHVEFLLNQLWISVVLVSGSDVISHMIRWIKYKTVKPSI